jgi:hypothetical protein
MTHIGASFTLTPRPATPGAGDLDGWTMQCSACPECWTTTYEAARQHGISHVEFMRAQDLAPRRARRGGR